MTVSGLWLFLTVLWVGLPCVIVVFPYHTHILLYLKILINTTKYQLSFPSQSIGAIAFRTLVKSVEPKFYFFLFLNQSICCGYSKEPSQ